MLVWRERAVHRAPIDPKVKVGHFDAAFSDGVLIAIERIARQAHYFASFGDVAKFGGEIEQPLPGETS